MRLVFSVVALTGLLGMSVTQDRPSDAAALGLTGIVQTVAKFPGSSAKPSNFVASSPFERTAIWAIGLFIESKQPNTVTPLDRLGVTYADLPAHLPQPIHFATFANQVIRD